MSENEVDSNAGTSPVTAGAADGENAVADPPSMSDASVADDSPVAGALAELDTLAARDLAEHPEVFDRIHDELHAALTAIDDA